jgi:hypothetical protein
MVKSLTRNVLGCGLAILLLSSCSSFQTVDPVVISTKPLDRPELILPPTDQLTMRDVEWVIITEENYEYHVNTTKAEGRPVAFFALTGDGYANLGLNFSDIRAYVQQQKTIIAAYEAYYNDSEEVINIANDQLKELDGKKLGISE